MNLGAKHSFNILVVNRSKFWQMSSHMMGMFFCMQSRLLFVQEKCILGYPPPKTKVVFSLERLFYLKTVEPHSEMNRDPHFPIKTPYSLTKSLREAMQRFSFDTHCCWNDTFLFELVLRYYKKSCVGLCITFKICFNMQLSFPPKNMTFVGTEGWYLRWSTLFLNLAF